MCTDVYGQYNGTTFTKVGFQMDFTKAISQTWVRREGQKEVSLKPEAGLRGHPMKEGRS